MNAQVDDGIIIMLVYLQCVSVSDGIDGGGRA